MQTDGLFLKLWKIKSIIFKICFSNLLLHVSDKQDRQSCAGAGVTTDNTHDERDQALVTTWGRPGGGTSITTLSEMTRHVRNMNYRYGVTGLVRYSHFLMKEDTFHVQCVTMSALVQSPGLWSLMRPGVRVSPMSQHAPAWSLLIPDQLQTSSSPPHPRHHVPSWPQHPHIVTPSATGARKWKILISINLL